MTEPIFTNWTAEHTANWAAAPLNLTHRLSQDLGAWGPRLDAILQAAYAVAKRVRTETRIGEGAVSLATAAVARVQDLHGDLADRTAVMLGGDELGLMVARRAFGAAL